MSDTHSSGLERSCTSQSASDWLRMASVQDGVKRIDAYFSGHAYSPHRHDTYAIGYTLSGVQSFHYRGSLADSTKGKVIVIHPDEKHDGRAGSETGFRYRMLYIDPAKIRDALGAEASSLPFVKEAVFSDPRLLPALEMACKDMNRPLAPIQLDALISLIADSLLNWDQTARRHGSRTLIDTKAIDRVRDFLEENCAHTVRSEELEEIAQQNRYALARQFRAAVGTSPYRYLMQRRLEKARTAIGAGIPLAEVAALVGFSDQPHMTRQFRAAFGLSPGRWQSLSRKNDTCNW